MKIISFAAIALFSLFFISCAEEDYVLNQEEETVQLNEMFSQVVAYGQDVPCTNASEWEITPIGQKACGGPEAYIAYHTAIDTVVFFKLVEEYNNFEIAFNQRWGISSDCSVPPMPTDVECDNGEPVLVY